MALAHPAARIAEEGRTAHHQPKPQPERLRFVSARGSQRHSTLKPLRDLCLGGADATVGLQRGPAKGGGVDTSLVAETRREVIIVGLFAAVLEEQGVANEGGEDVTEQGRGADPLIRYTTALGVWQRDEAHGRPSTRLSSHLADFLRLKLSC